LFGLSEAMSAPPTAPYYAPADLNKAAAPPQPPQAAHAVFFSTTIVGDRQSRTPRARRLSLRRKAAARNNPHSPKPTPPRLHSIRLQ